MKPGSVSLFLMFLMSLGVASRSLSAPPHPSVKIQLGAHESKSLTIPDLETAAVADSHLVRARAIAPSTLLLTGLKPGRTTVRAWDQKTNETVYDIEVIAADLRTGFAEGDGQGVIKVSLEFLEISSLIGESLGVRWPDALQFSGAGQVDSATSGVNYTATFSSARGLIQMLVRQGWGRLLAKPEIHVRLGEEARFHSGGEFPIAMAVPSYGRYTKQVDWKPYGLTVKVRPQSGDKLHISSDIRVEISEMNPGGGMEGIPALTRRQLDTKMNSRDGETVLLSGLVRQINAVEKAGIPILSDIPLFGSLFSSKTTTGEGNEILMAVTFSFVTRAGTEEKIGKFREKFEAAVPQ